MHTNLGWTAGWVTKTNWVTRTTWVTKTNRVTRTTWVTKTTENLSTKKLSNVKRTMYALRVETQIRLTEDDGLLIRPDEELLYMKCRNPKNINSLLHPNLNSKY